jgi:glycosyltransferase involved in cell wall biosynthesis
MVDTDNNNLHVSIIVRTKDRPKLLIKAIKSIAAQIYRPLEVILVNDGGDAVPLKEIKQILQDIPLNYIRFNENKGRAVAGNIGINNSTGKYIGFLDDDDEYNPEHISVLATYIQRNDNVKVAYTDSLIVFKEYDHKIDEYIPVKQEKLYSEDFSYEELLLRNYIPLTCLLFQRELLIEYGGFDTNFDLCEDWDLHMRLGKDFNYHHIRKTTTVVNKWDPNSQIFYFDKDYNSPVESIDYRKNICLKIISKHSEEYNDNIIFYLISKYNYMIFYLKKQMGQNLTYREPILSKAKRCLHYFRCNGLIALLKKFIGK